jgi:hypothetical protein
VLVARARGSCSCTSVSVVAVLCVSVAHLVCSFSPCLRAHLERKRVGTDSVRREIPNGDRRPSSIARSIFSCMTSRRRSWPRRTSRGRHAEPRMARATFPPTSGARSGSGTGRNAPFRERVGDARSGGTSSGTTASRLATRGRRRWTTSPCDAAPTTCTRAELVFGRFDPSIVREGTEIYAVSREFAPFRNGDSAAPSPVSGAPTGSPFPMFRSRSAARAFPLLPFSVSLCLCG